MLPGWDPPNASPLPFPLPVLARRRPRSYEEWSALRRWGRLPAGEQIAVGYQLRTVREAEGLTQAALASLLGCSQQAVSQAERWESNPTIEFIRGWATAVGAEVGLVLGRRGES